MKKILLLSLILVACTKENSKQIAEKPKESESAIDHSNGIVIPSNLVSSKENPNVYYDFVNKTKLEINGEFRNESPLDAKLILSKKNLNLGSLVNGQVPSFEISILNEGTTEASNIEIKLDNSLFFIKEDNCSHKTLQSKDTCSFRVGTYGDKLLKGLNKLALKVEHEEKTSSPELFVRATKVDKLESSILEPLQENPVSFVVKDTKEVVKNILIANRGPYVLDQLTTKLSSGEFKIIKNGCDSANLAINQYCSIQVSFDPKIHGNVERTAKITILDEKAIGTKVDINLSIDNKILQILAEKQRKEQEALESQRQKELKAQAKKLELEQKDKERKLEIEKKKEEERLAKEKRELEQKLKAEKQAKEDALKKEQQKIAEEKALEERRKLEEEKKLKAQQLKEEQEKIAQEKEQARIKKQEELLALKKKKEEQEKLEKQLKEEQLAKLLSEKEAQKQAKIAQMEQRKLEEKILKEQKEQELKIQKAKKEEEKQKALELAKLKKEQQELEKREQEELLKAEMLAKKLELERIQKEKLEEAKIKKEQKQLEEKLAYEEKLRKEEEVRLEKEKIKEEKRLAKIKSEEEAKQKALIKAEQEKLRLAEEKALKEQIAFEEKLKKEELAEQLRQKKMQALEEKRLQDQKNAELKAQALEEKRLEKVRLEELKAQELENKKQEELKLAELKAQEKQRLEQLKIQQALDKKAFEEKLAQEEAIKKEQELIKKQQEAYENELAKSKTEQKEVIATTLPDKVNVVEVQNTSVNQEVAVKEDSMIVVDDKIEDSVLASALSKIKKEEVVQELTLEKSGSSGDGTTGLTLKSSQGSGPIEVSYFKGLANYSLNTSSVLSKTNNYLEYENKTLQIQDGKVQNQEQLLKISQNEATTIDATNLDQDVEVNISGNSSSCSFNGFFSYFKCVLGSVKFKLRDLINNQELDPIVAYNTGNESNKIHVKKYAISQIHEKLTPSSQTSKTNSIFQNQLFLQAKVGDGKNKLFKISNSSISQVSDVSKGDDNPLRLITHNGELYYSGVNEKGLTKLFKTDGKSIIQISNIFPDGNDYFSPVAIYENELYLEGMTPTGDLKLFKILNNKLLQVSDTNPNGSDAPSDFLVYGNELYFRALNMSNKSKLFKLSKKGIYQVSDLNPEADDAPEFLEIYKGKLYFAAYKQSIGIKLFSFDGHVITQVGDINKGKSDEVSDLKSYKDDLYFIAKDSQNRRKLFKTDGKSIDQFSNLRSGYSDFAVEYRDKPSYLVIYNGELYFIAKNNNNAFKVFKTDGARITQVSNINNQDPEKNPTGSDFPFNLTVFDGELFFSAYANNSGLKLFKIKSETSEGK